MIEIKNLTKKYGEKKAAANVNLTIENNDIFAFVGHNGAGKTTTIKAIVGILDFDEGDILIDGISIKEKPIECKKNMAYIPDSPDLYEHLTGEAYINFIADIYGINNNLKNENIKKYADMFEITPYLGNPIASYSHGMKQKIALISALVHEPKNLILDEPFVGLDPISSKKLKDVMHNITQNGGSIFFSTHILEVAEKLCNKIAIIKNGKIIKSGLMKEVIKDKNLEDIFMELESE